MFSPLYEQKRLVVVLVIFVIGAQSDDFFGKVLPGYKSIFKNSPKAWHDYNRAQLFMQLVKMFQAANIPECVSCAFCLHQRFSGQFQKARKHKKWTNTILLEMRMSVGLPVYIHRATGLIQYIHRDTQRHLFTCSVPRSEGEFSYYDGLSQMFCPRRVFTMSNRSIEVDRRVNECGDRMQLLCHSLEVFVLHVSNSQWGKNCIIRPIGK